MRCLKTVQTRSLCLCKIHLLGDAHTVISIAFLVLNALPRTPVLPCRYWQQWVMNPLKPHHTETLWVSPAAPSDPDPSLWASPNELFIYYSGIGMSHVCRHRGALKNGAECQSVFFWGFFSPLKPNKSLILFQAYLHTVLTHSALFARRESTNFTAALFQCSWNCLLSLNRSWIHAGMHIYSGFILFFVQQNILLFNGQCFWSGWCIMHRH